MLAWAPMAEANARGRTCLVTGATSGIGEATALGLAERGFRVVLAARSVERGERTRADIVARTGNDDVHVLLGDLARQSDVRALAAQVRRDHPDLSVLVNNAGVVLLSRETSPDGIEMMLAVNHLATFLLTHLLLDVLERNAPARIVNVASEAHRFGTLDLDDLQSERRYRAMRGYGATKLANLLFTFELARRLEGRSVTANCLHPGAVSTRLGVNNGWFGRVVTGALSPFFLSPQRGAETSIYLATAQDVDGVSGRYFVKRRERDPSATSRDTALAAKLWDASCELTGIRSFGQVDADDARA